MIRMFLKKQLLSIFYSLTQQEVEKARKAIPLLETTGGTISLYDKIESSYNQWWN